MDGSEAAGRMGAAATGDLKIGLVATVVMVMGVITSGSAGGWYNGLKSKGITSQQGTR